MGARAVIAAVLLVTATTAAPAGATYKGLENVTIRWEPCPDMPAAYGCVHPDDPDTVYVRQRGDREVLAHELMHVWDLRILTDNQRAWLKPKLGYRRFVPWWGPALPGTPKGDFPAERFADAGSPCLRGIRIRPQGPWIIFWDSGYDPTPRRQRLICNAIAALDLTSPPTRHGSG